MKIKFLTLGFGSLFVAWPTVAEACSVCFFGPPDDPANKGLRMAILCLLGILAVLMVLFTAFFFQFCKRSKLMLRNQS